MGLYRNKDKITIIDEAAVAPGAAPVSAKEILVGIEDRPNGLYAYATALLLTLVFTATPGGGAVDMAAKKAWQVLKAVTIHYAKSFKRATNLSGLNIIRLGYQNDEIYSPDLVGSAFPVLPIEVAGGAQVITLKILYPLAIRDTLGDESARYTGLIPLSALKTGSEIAVQVCSAALIDAAWTIGNIALKVDMLTANFVDPLPHVAVYEVWEDYTKKRATLPGNGDRLYSAILGTDDTDANFTLPSSMTVECDGAVIRNLVDGDDLVTEENLGRMDGINDVAPAVCPVLTTTGRTLDECLPARREVVLENMNDSHVGNYGVLVRYSQHLDSNSQRDMLGKHRVPAELIDAYIRRQESRSPAQVELEIGRVTTSLRAA
jgi:hypothetical protein